MTTLEITKTIYHPYGEVELRYGPIQCPSGILWGIVKLPNGKREVVNFFKREEFWIPTPEELLKDHQDEIIADLLREMMKTVTTEYEKVIIISLIDIKPFNPSIAKVSFG